MINATLTLIIKDNQILLGRKKRGLGNGLLNACGGKVEQGESAEQAMVRETQEEWGIKPLEYKKCAEILFEHKNTALNQTVHIYRADGFDGVPTETDEISVQWFDLDKIPFDRMWADDREWLPLVLDNNFVEGKFVFDENFNIIKHDLTCRSQKLTELAAALRKVTEQKSPQQIDN